jgi:hypothetical protein
MLGGMFLPFILMRDVYPFYRFAMFAEPLEEAVQLERLEILFDDAQGYTVQFSPDHFRISYGNFEVLKRRAFYKGEVQELLAAFQRAYPQPVSNWRMIRLVNTEFGTDTTHIQPLQP